MASEYRAFERLSHESKPCRLVALSLVVVTKDTSTSLSIDGALRGAQLAADRHVHQLAAPPPQLGVGLAIPDLLYGHDKSKMTARLSGVQCPRASSAGSKLERWALKYHPVVTITATPAAIAMVHHIS